MNKQIIAIAQQQGIDPSEVYQSIQEAIDYAWTSNDTSTKENQARLFGIDKPTPDQLIQTLAAEILQQYKTNSIT